MAEYPEVSVFDLDYTVWPCHCDTHLCPPFKPVTNSNGEVYTVVDARGFQLSFYKDIPRIIIDLKEHGSKILAASRTWAPDIAQTLLKTFTVSYEGKIVSLGDLFDAKEWGERSKVGHIGDGLKKIYGDSNLRKRKICLFDDEYRNKDVEKHGVKFIYIKDSENGPSWQLYQDFINGDL